MKKKVLSFLAMFIVILSSIGFACEPNDPGCTESTTVGANLFNSKNWTFGDAANGGFANTIGSECAEVTGNKASAFTGSLDSLNTGSFDNGISAANAVLSFAGKGTFNDIGNASITSAGEVKEGSFVSKTDPDSAYYFNAGQLADAKMNPITVLGSTSPLEFNKSLSAGGVAGGSVDVPNKSFTVFANNTANGVSSANAANVIGGGFQTPNTMVELSGSANGCSTGGIVGTNGVGSGSITETALPNGFTLKANASVSESVTRTAN